MNNRERWAKVWEQCAHKCARTFTGQPMGDFRSKWVDRWFRALHKAEAAKRGDREAFLDGVCKRPGLDLWKSRS